MVHFKTYDTLVIGLSLDPICVRTLSNPEIIIVEENIYIDEK